MFRWLKKIFHCPNFEDGYKFAIESLESGKYTIDELFDMSNGMGLSRTAFDNGIRRVLWRLLDK